MATILIVDDRPTNRNFLVTLLSYGGHSLLEAADGAEAFELMRAQPPDLIITDILMPTMDGYEFVRKVRAEPNFVNIPVIFYTATYQEREARSLAKAAGTQYVLTKPAEPQAILDMVNTALGHLPAPGLPSKIITQPPLDPLQVVSTKLTAKMGELRDLGSRLEALVELVLKIGSEREPGRLLEVACDAARVIIGAEYAAVGMLEEDRRTLKHFVTSGLDPETIARIGSPPTGKGVLGKLLGEGQPVRLPDISADPDSIGFPPGHPPMRSFLGVPLASPTGLYGRLYLTEKIGASEFSEEDERIAAALGAQVAVAYENAYRYDEIQRHAANLQLEMTERRKAEEALRVENERFQTFVESNIVGIVIADAAGKIIAANDYYLNVLGVTRQDFLDGKVDWRKFTPPEWLPADEKAIRELLERGVCEPYEKEYERADGTRVPVYLADAMLPGPGEQIAAFVLDITERKRVEEALQESERRFRALIESGLDEIVVFNSQLKPIYMSPSVLRASEYSWAEMVEAEPFTSVHPEDQPAARKLYESLLQHPAQPQEYQLRLVRKDNSHRWTEGVAINLLDDPSVKGIVLNYRDITERKKAEAKIESHLERLSALRTIDLGITSSFDLHVTLNIILQQIITQLKVDAAAILVFNETSRELEFAAGHGFRGDGITRLRLRLGEDFAGRAAFERRLIHIPDLLQAWQRLSKPELIIDEGFVSFFAVPLIAKEKVKGVLEVFHRSTLTPDSEWLDFFQTLAGQTAIAIDNAELFNNLQRSNSDLILSYDATIEGWSRALDLRDKETEGHTQRVTEMTMILAREFGFTEEELLRIRWGALLHDIGKMGVPDHILLKPEPLTEAEQINMQKHPQYAYDLLKPIAFLQSAIEIPYCHHEKWDGTGYPRRLKGEEIPITARLFAIVDIWDALTSDRPYRGAWPREEVIAYIREQSGKHFDPRVVDLFFKIIK